MSGDQCDGRSVPGKLLSGFFGCTTPAIQITNQEEITEPSAVKCVIDEKGRAIYFSRGPIPFVQNPKNLHAFYRHLGVYCFRKDFLLTYASLPPTRLQQIEDLEQLLTTQWAR